MKVDDNTLPRTELNSLWAELVESNIDNLVLAHVNLALAKWREEGVNEAENVRSEVRASLRGALSYLPANL